MGDEDDVLDDGSDGDEQTSLPDVKHVLSG